MDLYIPPYRINNEKIFTPTKEAVLNQPRTVKAEQYTDCKYGVSYTKARLLGSNRC